MGDIEIKQINGLRGKAVRISNGEVELVAALDIGPRILHFGKIGGPNEFFEDINDNISHNEPEIIDYYGGNKGGWHIYGGHRLWTSPEKFPRTYYPDNRPVSLEIIDNGIILTQEPQTENGIQMKIKLVMDGDGTVRLEHYITNIGAWDISLAPWALSVMQVGGLVAIPQPNTETGFLHNRGLSLWPYSDMADSRVNWGTDFITLKTSADKCNAFKLGINSDHGYVAYYNHGNLFIKRFKPQDYSSEYPDNGVCFEAYTNNFITEIETVGKYELIKCGDTVCHTESWQLIPDVREPESADELRQSVEKYVLK